MKKIRKLLSFLTILCCLAGSAVPVEVSAAATPRVTFTNKPRNAPDLYVTKRVEGTPKNQYDQFRFVLKRNGEVAANYPYRLYQLDDAGGRQEIARMIPVSGNDNENEKENEKPFTTDESGIFVLEANQQALFEGIGTGASYEVVELDDYQEPKTDEKGDILYVPTGKDFYRLRQKFVTVNVNEETKEETTTTAYGDIIHKGIQYRLKALRAGGYRKDTPSNGTTGVRIMPFNGASVEFKNVSYNASGDLEILKAVSFPTNWKVPETQEFLFKLEVDGKAYNAEEFIAVNEATGETLTGKTSKDGYFTLRGGWKATFKNVPDNVDYQVSELQEKVAGSGEVLGILSGEAGAADRAMTWPQGWWATGDTVQHGSTPPTAPAVFSNSNVSFIVTKRLDDYTKPDVAFNFQLTDAQNNGMPGKSYYLYKTNGEPVALADLSDAEKAKYEEAVIDGRTLYTNTAEHSKILCGTTAADGSFSLKAGQAAVFIGISPGTSYKVVETGTPHYTQVLPEKVEIHTVDSKGGIQILDFTNKAIEENSILTVLKLVENTDGEGALTEEDFHFLLYKRLKNVDDFMKLFNVDVEEQDSREETGGNGTGQSSLPGWWKELSPKWKAVLRVLEYSKDSGYTLTADTTEQAGINAIKIFLDKKVNEKLAGSAHFVKTAATPTSGETSGEGSQQGSSTESLLENYQLGTGTTAFEIYLPVEGAVYSVQEGLSTPTYATGPGKKGDIDLGSGEFTLKANQTAKFEALSAGGQYLVREIDIAPEYSELTPAYAEQDGYTGKPADPLYKEIVIGGNQPAAIYDVEGEDDDSVSTTIPAAKKNYGQVTELTEAGAALTFTNIFKAEKIDLVLTKINNENPVKYLEGAQFMLFLAQGRDQANKYLPKDLEGITAENFCYTTAKDGTVTISGLKLGTYWLYETKAPSGYCLLKDPVKIQVTRTKPGAGGGTGGQTETGQLQVFINDTLYAAGFDQNVNSGDVSHIKVTDKTSANAPGNSQGNEESKAKIELTILNVELYELPNSGGMGIYWYSIGGMLLMMAASLILYRSKHRGEVLKD